MFHPAKEGNVCRCRYKGKRCLPYGMKRPFRRIIIRGPAGAGEEGVRLQSEPVIPAMKPVRKPGKNGRKLLFVILVFFITLFVILFFQSSISRITTITITGNVLTTKEEIAAASGVKAGDHFFTTGTSNIKKNLQSLKMIEQVRVTKKFPGEIKLEVKEFAPVAIQLAADGTREVLLADGSAFPAVGQAAALPLDLPILSGWRADDPQKANLCRTLATIPAQDLSDVSEIKPAPSNAYPDKIEIYTRSDFIVYTTIEYLPHKAGYLGFIINEMMDRGKDSGVITMLETDRHSDFTALSKTGEGNSSDGPSGLGAGAENAGGDSGNKTDPGEQKPAE